MATKQLVVGILAAAAGLALPLAGTAQTRTNDTRSHNEPMRNDEAPLRQTVQIDRTYDVPLQTGCTYHATIHGTLRPVARGRGEEANVQRLRPDLLVGAAVRCPNSTESHIQERAVRSTGVARDELEHLVALNASVQRMQNSGTCMYLPDVTLTNGTLEIRDVRYLCPSDRGGSRGGGPRDGSRWNDGHYRDGSYRFQGGVRY